VHSQIFIFHPSEDWYFFFPDLIDFTWLGIYSTACHKVREVRLVTRATRLVTRVIRLVTRATRLFFFFFFEVYTPSQPEAMRRPRSRRLKALVHPRDNELRKRPAFPNITKEINATEINPPPPPCPLSGLLPQYK